MIEILYLAILLAGSFGFGSFVLSRFGFRFYSMMEEFFLSVAFSYALLILVTYWLGFSRLLYPALAWVMLLATLLFGFGALRRLFNSLRRVKFSWNGWLNMEFWLFSLIAFFTVFFMLASLAPPWSYDTTVYHLAVPKIYAMEKGFVEIPTLMHSQWVMAPHMLFLFAILLKNPVLANLVNFSFAILLAVGIYAFCCRFLDRKTGLFAVAVFLTLPMVGILAVSAHADLGLAFFAFTAFYAFACSLENDKGRKMLLLAGFFSGAAAGSKMIGLFFLPVIPLIIVARQLVSVTKRSLQAAIPAVLARLWPFFLAALPLAAVGYVKNWVYSGNPFYPLFFSVFGGKYLDAAVVQRFTDVVSGYGTGVSLPSLLLLPWNITMNPVKFVDLLGIGPLFLAFVPLAVLLPKPRVVKLAIAVGLLSLLSWFFVSQALRYALYAFPVLSIVVAFSIVRLCSALPRRIATAFLVLPVLAFFAFSTILLFGSDAKQVPVGLGLEPDANFFAGLDDGNIFAECKFANENLGNGSRLLLLYENRGFHCNLPYHIGIPDDQTFIDFASMQSDGELAARLRETKISHLVVNRNSPVYQPGKNPYSGRIPAIIGSFISNYTTRLYSGPNADIYAFAAS